MLYNHLLQIHEATKKTILFVTHNINEALLLGNRVIVLSPSLGNIKKDVLIDLPRPRDIDSSELLLLKRQILKELEEDFQIARKENTTATKEKTAN
jgi:NitT/TauT family transport system ATP-binding protein